MHTKETVIYLYYFVHYQLRNILYTEYAFFDVGEVFAKMGTAIRCSCACN